VTTNLSSTRVEILATASALRPVQLEARWGELKRFGLNGGFDGEAVSQSFGHPMPVDKDGRAGDGFDRIVAGAERAYTEAMKESLKHLHLAMAIQAEWLKPVHIATKKERQLASDTGPDCLGCDRPMAYTPRDRPRRGLCPECYMWWYRNGYPEISALRKVRAGEAVA
jgi:hypothetical protein